MKKISIVPTILSIFIIVLAVSAIPGFSNYFYQLGAGHEFLQIMDTTQAPWDDVTGQLKPVYKEQSEIAGRKCALYMILGQHIPGYLFLLIMIGLLTPSLKGKFRTYVKSGFWITWILGLLFLTIGSGYWGQALPFSKAIIPSTIIYTFVAIVCGVVFLIGKFVQRLMMVGSK